MIPPSDTDSNQITIYSYELQLYQRKENSLFIVQWNCLITRYHTNILSLSLIEIDLFKC